MIQYKISEIQYVPVKAADEVMVPARNLVTEVAPLRAIVTVIMIPK